MKKVEKKLKTDISSASMQSGIIRSYIRFPCENLKRLNALVTPGEVEEFEVFERDFCLTDIVMNLWTFPEGMSSKASCSIWLVNPSPGSNVLSEILFKCIVDKYGHQIHLNSGIFCPKGSHLTANSGLFVEGATSSLRVLLSGFFCHNLLNL